MSATIDRTGEIKYSNKYRMLMTIVGYRCFRDIDVKFEDGYVLYHTVYNRFNSDSIRRPSDAPYVYVGDAVGRRQRMRCGMEAEIVSVTGSDPYNLRYEVRFDDGTVVYTTKYSKFTSGGIGHPNINIKGKLLLKKERVGEQCFSKRYSMPMTILAYRRFNDIDVLFEDGVVAEHKSYDYFLKDGIARPDIYTYAGNALGRRQKMNCGLFAEIIAISKSGKAGHFDIKFDDGVIVEDKSLYNFMNGEIAHPSQNSMINKKATEYIGLRRQNNNGFWMEIVAYRNSQDIDVKFDVSEELVTSRMNQWKTGGILEPEAVHLEFCRSKYLGNINISKNGQQMKIVGWRSAADIDVLFEDGTLVCGKGHSNFLNGFIQNPNCPTKGHFKFCGVHVGALAYRFNQEVNYHCVLPNGDNDILTLTEILEHFGGIKKWEENGKKQ